MRVPPVHETHTVDRVQHHLDALLPSQLFSPEYGRILELQAYPVVPHVCAHVNGKQGQRHAHDDRSEDEVEGGDPEQVAV